MKKWKTKKFNNELAANLSEKYGFDPFFSLLLVARGYDTKEKIDAFLNEDALLCDQFLITDMSKAVVRINTALENGEKICVYGDYDADGVTSTAIVFGFLESQGGNVIHCVPQRSDGYGMNKESLQALKAQGVFLIITVDNGISATEEADFAKEIGIDLIITDHHQIGEKLPNALAIVNPHRDNLPFTDWAGVGVAFKLICALYDGDVQDLIEDYGDLVAIGTVADMVPLVGENRTLVKAGLKVINENQRPGLVAFRQVANMQDRVFTSNELAFLIAPKINAAGRMDDATIALNLLVEENIDNAVILAQQLIAMNTERQKEEQATLGKIFSKLATSGDLEEKRVLVVYGEGYNSGVIGIVASRLVETFGKPAVVLTNDSDGMAKGSCRSIDGFSIYDALSACSEDLEKFGGHTLAAGLSLKIQDVEAFSHHINEYAYSNFPLMPVSEISIDCSISPGYLTIDLLNSINQLAPFGMKNEQPIFGIIGAEISKIMPVGEGKHLKISCKKGNIDFNVMCFGTSEKDFLFSVGDKVDLAVKVSSNVFRGVENVSIQAVDIRPNKLQHSTFLSEKDTWIRFQKGERISQEIMKCVAPTREISAKIYRFLVKKNGYSKSMEGLYFALSKEHITYSQMMISLKAFEQLGLVTICDGKIEMVVQNGKVDLSSAPILIDLKSRIDYGQ